MKEYHVFARRYRPHLFRDVLGQSHVITALQNAVKHKRVAHAYLFCGSHGTGKTTVTRLLAKVLQCEHCAEDIEPCNACSSCHEIAQGNSLDVIEIDGASNRGIDDIRNIKETAGYAKRPGKYTIYIIDEVHMLTKEAFNALLKILEDPPEKVKFFFATTEPHKIPATIISRCQRYQLKRLSLSTIATKLRHIARDISLDVSEDALLTIARLAEGGMRDAESIFDQLIAYTNGSITQESVSDLLGLMPKQSLHALDTAGKEGALSAAFSITEQLFSDGKNISFFIESLISHFRSLLLTIVGSADLLTLTSEEREYYQTVSSWYSKEQCMTILSDLSSLQTTIRTAPSKQIALEMALLKIIRSHQQLPIERLVERLSELETRCHASLSERPQENGPKGDYPSPKPHDYDTIVQFSAVELNGTVHKSNYH